MISSTMEAAGNGGSSSSSSSSSSSGGACNCKKWWDLLTFGWFTPFLLLVQCKLDMGQKHDGQHTTSSIDLEDEDESDRIPSLPTKDYTSEAARVLETLWAAEQKRCPNNPNLKCALWNASAKSILFAGTLSIIGTISSFVGPMFILQIVPYLSEPSPSLGYGLGWTAILFLAYLTQSLCNQHAKYICCRTGIRTRSSLMVFLFRKALMIDASYYQDHPVGRVFNLMSVDVSKVSAFVEMLPIFVTFPFQLGLALVTLWVVLGPSCLGGVLVIVIVTPVANRSAQWMSTFNVKLMKAKDDRINSNHETFTNMKIVKYQAWEEPFRDRVEDFRKKEIRQLFYFKVAGALFGILTTITPMLVVLVSFCLYVTIQGQTLDTATALAAVDLFNKLKIPLSAMPQILNFAINCNVALERIRDYLMAPNYEPPQRLTNGNEKQCDEDEEGMGSGTPRIVVDIKDATFSYQRIEADKGETNQSLLQCPPNITEQESLLDNDMLADDEEQGRPPSQAQYGSTDYNKTEDPNNVVNDEFKKTFPLRGVNFECREGEFIAVVGGVGSGKSTFLKALLGEVQKVSGEARVQGDVAYFDQNPFIMSDTLKGNILFGKGEEKTDGDLYRLAVEASCLEHDFKLFTHGDQTEIGEKGTNLSGGQKARVAIGRAVYRDADISLLDDCLSAVDAHVGRDLFDKCIVGVLLKRKREAKRKKTVILVTNALQYLSHPMLDRIVVLEDGVVAESGSYSDLVSREKSLFKSMYNKFNQSHVNENSSKNHQEEGKEYANDEEVDSETQQEDDEEEYDNDEDDFDELFEDESELVDQLSRTSSIMISLPSTRSSSLLRPSMLSDASSKHHSEKSSTENKKAEKASKLHTDEMANGQVGKVDAKLYMIWAKAAGGLWIAIPLFLVLVMPILAELASTGWITIWGASEETDESSQLFYLGILALIYLVCVFLGVIQELTPVYFGLKASTKFFSSMLDTMLNVPMSFYDTNPTGRLLNRFDKDIDTLDQTLVVSFTAVASCLLSVLRALFLIIAASPFVILPLPILIMYYKRQYDFYNQSNRELKRIDSRRKSPAFNLFTEALNGYCTIRAFGVEPALLHRMFDAIDKQQHASYLLRSGQVWLGVRLEFVGTCLVTIGCFAFVATKYFNPDLGDNFILTAGTALPYILNVSLYLNYLVRNASELEANMVAVERIDEYIQLEKEAPHHTPTDNSLDKDWPSKGLVEFKNVNMRYRSGCPLVLKGLNVVIPSKAKVGICGRTGAGKSTLINALMRLSELDDGQILLDGVDIKTVGLTKLRSSIAIVPQDPVLFSGTVLSNIDPFHRHSRDRLMDVLDHVGLLGSSIKSVEDKVEQDGSNFSAGQRQLLVIARALLDDASVVICDEATASIDAEADARIQRVFRTEFAETTALTVAHRLNTIMDSTHILAMSDGKAAEFDSPSALLSSKDSLFKDLVNADKKNAKLSH